MVDGFPIERLNELRTHFPSLRPIAGHHDARTARLLSLRFPDIRQCTEDGYFQIVIQCGDLSHTIPKSWVINYEEGGGASHPHLWRRETIPGTTKMAFWVCDGTWSGNILPIYNALENDPVQRLLGYIEHLISVLNTN